MSTTKRESGWKNRRTYARAQREREARHRKFAQAWFSGDTACPKCGGDRFSVVHSNSGGDTRIESFRCDAPGCEALWRVESRESAIAVMDDGSGPASDWFDRDELHPQPVFRIEIVDGVVERVSFVAGNPEALDPKFVVREIESDDSLEHDRVAGIDDSGEKFAEHPVAYVGPDLTE